jgi:hypothetical protein
VLLYNQADFNIFYPGLLSKFKDAQCRIKVKGLDGVQLIANEVGELIGYPVYSSEQTKANALSFIDLQEMCDIKYARQ